MIQHELGPPHPIPDEYTFPSECGVLGLPFFTLMRTKPPSFASATARQKFRFGQATNATLKVPWILYTFPGLPPEKGTTTPVYPPNAFLACPTATQAPLCGQA